MKIAHLADVHLGFRRFQRTTSGGINQREADVATAFARAIDGVIVYSPDIVLIAGDLFHSVRPSNPAILHAFNQLKRLREGCPEAPVVIIAGNHDTPRSVETGAILKLFEAFGNVFSVTGDPQTLEFPYLDLSVLCVPHQAVRGDRPRFSPEGDARFNILLTHGMVEGVVPHIAGFLDPGVVLVPDELHAPSWSYVALGHYHVAHAVASNAWFSGSLEYVTTNPWGELIDERRERRAGKGWLAVDIGDELSVQFRPLELNRRFIDLEPIEAKGMDSSDLDELIASRVAGIPGGIEGAVVRQRVWNVNPTLARDLDHRQVRELKARALNYNLDLRREEKEERAAAGAAPSRVSLSEQLINHLKATPMDSDVDRKAVVKLARHLLSEIQTGEND